MSERSPTPAAPSPRDDHAALDEGLVAERYLIGQLAPEEREAFEEHYLDCELCLERLELGRRLQGALAQVAAEEGARAAGRLGILAALVRLGRGGRALLAAALVAAFLLPLGLLVERGARLSRIESDLQALRAPQTQVLLAALSPVRSAAAPPSTRITLPEPPGWIVLALELRDPAFERYRATLRRGSEAVWRGDDLVPSARGEVVLSLYSSSLEAGDHELELAGLSPSGEAMPVASFRFAVVEP